MRKPKGEARRRELFRYFDDRFKKHWLPARYIGKTARLGEPPDLFTGVKPYAGNTDDDQLHIVFAGNARGTAVFSISDGDPLELAGALQTAVLSDCMIGNLFTYGLLTLIPKTYLTRQGFDIALFLPPDWLTHSSRVAHRPRSLRWSWHILMMVFLTKKEHAMARTDARAMFDHFDRTGRDFMTVHAPYVMPDWKKPR